MSNTKEIVRIARIVEALRQYDPDMPLQTAAVFLAVATRPGITMKDLGDKLHIAQSTCSRNIAALSKWHRMNKPGLDLIVAKEDPSERRRKQAFLTRKGEMLADSLVEMNRG